MKKTMTRSHLKQALIDTYADPALIAATLSNPDLPQDLADWMSRMALLKGVPFNYLVPDERMLPPESIRFFYLDQHWIDALCDGAFSIGRNLTTDDNSSLLNLDRSVWARSLQLINQATTQVRANLLGTDPPPAPVLLSGFLLRSSLVLDYPSLGVNAYPEGWNPSGPDNKLLDILRLEKLGPQSDTLICLVSGDAVRFDIHEAPQALHYGIDCFMDQCMVGSSPVDAVKNLHPFELTVTTNPDGTTSRSVTMSETATPCDISGTFRSIGTRVINMQSLAAIIPRPANLPAVDAAIMGFEMTEGVGMVSFLNSQKQQVL